MRIVKISLAALLVTALLIELLNIAPVAAAPKKVTSQATSHISESSGRQTAVGSSTTHNFVSGPFTLQAVEIDGTDAHLKTLPNLLEPILVFSAVTMRGMRLSHAITTNLSLVLSASGNVTGSGVAIQTSVFSDLKTALGSFTDQADLLVLLAGGTVHHIVMKNVNLKVDRSIQASSIFLPGMHLAVTSG
ncbi:MAG TPA: hypothetical protein VFU49_25260 [Ktedonobacteraceae bacterium]|nr:hypothetical protein [Ktedonobacteraceae bacterium]